MPLPALYDALAHRPLLPFAIMLVVVMGTLLLFFELMRYADRVRARAPGAIQFAKDNFDALSTWNGFITVDTLYEASKKFPEHAQEIAFLRTHIYAIGKPIQTQDLMTYSAMGPGLPATISIFGISRAQLRGLEATVSPLFGNVRFTRTTGSE